MIKGAENFAIFTGAAINTRAGIPDCRSRLDINTYGFS